MSAQPIDYIIFGDASVKSGHNGRTYCGFGTVILNVDTKEYTAISGELGGHTIAFGEAWAILRGLQVIRDIAKKNPSKKILQGLVVTDSKLTVQTLSVYIPYVWDLSDYHDWKKADGKSVKNQEVYRRIVDLMHSTPEMHVRVTHINSHLSKSDWVKIQGKLQAYGIHVRRKTAQTFREMNALADRMASETTEDMRDVEEIYGDFPRLILRDPEEATPRDKVENDVKLHITPQQAFMTYWSARKNE